MTFFSDDDHRYYLDALHTASKKYGVLIHAYVLMTNHIHLLLTPSDEMGIAKVMQSIGRCYVQYINKTYKRSGTLWEGRHKASLIQAEEYLLSCYRYIELNPVNASMVEHPGEYPWTSYHYNAAGKTDRIITEHAIYTGLGLDKAERLQSYRELFMIALDKEMVHSIRNAADFSVPLGNDRFRDQIEKALGKKVGYAKRGRPMKQTGKKTNEKDS